jgi:hypothetical protein
MSLVDPHPREPRHIIFLAFAPDKSQFHQLLEFSCSGVRNRSLG